MSLSQKRIEKLRIASKHITDIEKKFKPLIKSIGECTFVTIGSPFEVLIKSIIGQQLSTKSASRLEEKFIHLFPMNSYKDPKDILNLGSQEWSSVGISKAKKETILRVSELYLNKNILDEDLKKINDEEVLQILCNIKGVGPWTAEMVLIFGLDRWNHFSVGDLILRRGIEKWIGISQNDKKQIIEYTNQFSPYKTILSWYLWKDFDGGAGGWS
jgi:DNA-3-methyladenine glycosylase II